MVSDTVSLLMVVCAYRTLAAQHRMVVAAGRVVRPDVMGTELMIHTGRFLIFPENRLLGGQNWLTSQR